MGWQDRQYDDTGGGGFRGVVRRVFGDGENPLSWSVPMYTAWGIAVRIHIFYIVYIVAMLISSINGIGITFMLIGMGMLFVMVLLHEYGHCVACRRVGGEADRIIMWPLGGLAFCAPPHTWRANLVTAVGGPMVNVLLVPVFGLFLLAATGSLDSVLFNPFNPDSGMLAAVTRQGIQPLWLNVLWWAYFMNLVLLGFNVLVPMYPMDGGRILHAILWARTGELTALSLTTTIGLIAAGIMAVCGLVFEQHLLFAIALFGGITCFLERQRMKFEGASGLPGGYDFSRGYAGMPQDKPERRPGKAAQRRARQREKDQAELDRLLDKIAREGMGKLTRKERRFLERESDKRRER